MQVLVQDACFHVSSVPTSALETTTLSLDGDLWSLYKAKQ